MEEIRVQALMYHSQREHGKMLVVTNYDTFGEGISVDQARLSAQCSVIQKLDRYVLRGEEPPKPFPYRGKLSGLDAVADHFYKFIPQGKIVVEDLTVVRAPEKRPEGVVPPLVFEFYRVEEN